MHRLKRRQTNIPEDGLETEEEYRHRWISIRIIYFTMFLMSLGFSVVLTGIWPFLDKLDPTAGKEFMGYVVASNPFGQMLFSPLFGYWGNKSHSVRLPLFCSIAIFSIASGIYSSLELFPMETVKYWMFLSRFLVGVGSANITLCRSYLSDATRLKERTGAVSMVSLAQVLGFIVGPSLQAIVTPLGSHGITLFNKTISINMYTAAGWINVFMGIGNFLLFLPIFFKEKRIAAKEIMILQGKQTEKETWKGIKPDYLSAWTLIVAFFVLVFNFVLLETIGTSLTMDQFAWTKGEALYYMGILMSVGAVVACVTFVGIKPLCEKFHENSVLLWGGFFLMAVGRILYIPWGDSPPRMAIANNITDDNQTELVGCPMNQEWCLTTPAMTMTQFLLGYFLTCVGYPIGVTLIQTIFTKILGPRPQGVWMGMITGSGCLSRILGPVCVGYVYTRYGTYPTFGLTFIMMVGAMLWFWILRNRLKVPDYQKTNTLDVEHNEQGDNSPIDESTVVKLNNGDNNK